MKRSLLFGTIVVAVFAVAAGLYPLLVPPLVQVVLPEVGPAVEAVYATGTVEPTVMMPIAARGAARLTELNVDEGSEVKKSQQLAQLEDDDLKHSLAELQAKEIFVKDEFERKASLLKRGFATKEAHDQARAEWDAAKAAVGRASAQADYMRLLAPADGRIIRRDGEIGQLIPANQPIFWLSCCAPLRISSEVDEEDIARVQPGQKVLIRADAFPGKTFQGTVQSITPKGDPVARSYRVRVELTGETPLLIGMTAETNIILQETEKALLLPTSAVKDGKIWLVKEGMLVEQPVEIGAKGSEKTEVKTGVNAEDKVVLKPNEALSAGEKVRAKLVKP